MEPKCCIPKKDNKKEKASRDPKLKFASFQKQKCS